MNKGDLKHSFMLNSGIAQILLDCKENAPHRSFVKAGYSDLIVLNGRTITKRIKITLGITGLSGF